MLCMFSRKHSVFSSFRLFVGDAVAIYMPIVPEICVAMLACARIGAIHTVIFAGFSSQVRDKENGEKEIERELLDEGKEMEMKEEMIDRTMKR